MAVSIGIDLGTTYSCVATHRRGQTEVIMNAMGERTTPSYVSFSDEERLVGGAAKSKAARNPKNTVFDVKRMIGRVFSDPIVQSDRKLWPFTVVKAEDSDRPQVEVEYRGETKRFFAEEISSMVLAYMKEQAEKYIGEPVKDAVITVPAYFNDAQRQATKDAGAIAGLNVLRVINEPTAAALAYGLNQKLGTDEERNVLVFDLGGGTFDVSLLSIDDAMYEVKATAGDTHLGGEDFDNLLVQHFVKEFKRKHRLDLMTSKRAMRRLRTACERAKRTLSASTRAMVEVDSLFEGIDFASSITRSRFEQLCMPLFQRCLQPVESVLRDAGMAKSEIHDVVMVGGSTRIPRVRQMVSDFFGGKQLQQGVNPDEAVAVGAAVQACQLTGGDESGSLPTVVDVTPLSLGLETAGGLMTTLVPRGSVIPTRKQEVFTTHADNQTAVTIRVFQGERQFTKDNVLLGSFDLKGIAPAPRGVPQVEVSFEVDADSILSVKATDRGSSRSQKIRIEQQSGRLTQQQIEDMIKQGEAMQEQDRALRRAVEARNELENLAYSIKQALGESPVKDAVTAEERAQVEQAVDAALAWVDQLPSEASALSLDEIAEQKRALESVWHPVVARVQGGGASAGGAQHHEGDTSGPRVDEVD